MPTWPEALPQRFLQDDYKETDRDLVIGFKTDIGPPLTRKRGSTNVLIMSGSMVLTTSQKNVMRSFWETYCANTFDFPDPADPDESTISVMFDYESPPVYVPYAGTDWKVSFQLFLMPE